MKLGPFTLNTIQRRCILKLKALQETDNKPDVDLANPQHISALLRASCDSDQRTILDYAELFSLASIGDIRAYLLALHVDLDRPTLRKAELSRAMKTAKRRERAPLKADMLSEQYKINADAVLKRRASY